METTEQQDKIIAEFIQYVNKTITKLKKRIKELEKELGERK
jgi:uncharacterized protein YtpQ (UPF0354 family)